MRNFSAEAEVVNVSKSGISVECAEKLDKGCVYTIRLIWHDTTFEAKCEAIWCLNDGSDQRYRSGMRFLEIEKDRVDDFLSCIEEQMSDACKRLHPRMRATGTKALLSYP